MILAGKVDMVTRNGANWGYKIVREEALFW